MPTPRIELERGLSVSLSDSHKIYLSVRHDISLNSLTEAFTSNEGIHAKIIGKRRDSQNPWILAPKM